MLFLELSLVVFLLLHDMVLSLVRACVQKWVFGVYWDKSCPNLVDFDWLEHVHISHEFSMYFGADCTRIDKINQKMCRVSMRKYWVFAIASSTLGILSHKIHKNEAFNKGFQMHISWLADIKSKVIYRPTTVFSRPRTIFCKVKWNEIITALIKAHQSHMDSTIRFLS